MLIGFTVAPYKKWSPDKIVTGLQSLGIRFVELNQRAVTDAEKLGASLRGMTTAYHLPNMEDDGWDFSLSEFSGPIKNTLSLLERHGKTFRLKHVISHPPEPMLEPGTVHPLEAYLFENLLKLNLPVFFENVESWDPVSFQAFLHRGHLALGPRYAGMCFDAAHFYIKGFNPAYQFTAFQPQIGAIHLSDCRPGRDLHLPFACGGNMPVPKLLDLIRKSRFNGAITLEMMPYTTAQIVPFVQSYLTILKVFNRRKYLLTLIRFWTFRRLLKTFSH